MLLAMFDIVNMVCNAVNLDGAAKSPCTIGIYMEGPRIDIKELVAMFHTEYLQNTNQTVRLLRNKPD
jgi:hypothetical protein